MITFLETSTQLKTIALAIELRGIGQLALSENDGDTAWLYHVVVNDEWRDYYVAYVGSVDSKMLPDLSAASTKSIPVRIDSGCITGMTFGDKSCECKEQLDAALQLIRQNGVGFVIHIPSQDGRGMGIDFKLRTLDLQLSQHYDTVQAARTVAGSDYIDRRTYHGAIACLRFLGLDQKQALNIATNNPDKVEAFVQGGFTNFVETRIHIPVTSLTKHHLAAKKQHLKHLL